MCVHIIRINAGLLSANRAYDSLINQNTRL